MISPPDDFNLWTQRQVEALRNNRFADLDTDALIEEIEGMSKSDRRALKSHLIILMAHRLKLLVQPHYPNKASWLRSIQNAQLAIDLILEDSPSLAPLLPDYIQSGYPKAVSIARLETGLEGFPAECPFDMAELNRRIEDLKT